MLSARQIPSKIGPNLRPSSRKKHLAIIQAARRVFLEHGFSGSSVDLIAEKAGVSKRTVYKHFDDKYSLFSAVIQMLCERVVPSSVDALEVATDDPGEILTELGVHFLERVYTPEQIELFRIVIAEARRFPELGQMMYRRIRSQRAIVGQYLEELQEKNKIRLPCQASAASQYFSLLKEDAQMRLLFGRRKRFSQAEIREMAECGVMVFLNGVVPRE